VRLPLLRSQSPQSQTKAKSERTAVATEIDAIGAAAIAGAVTGTAVAASAGAEAATGGAVIAIVAAAGHAPGAGVAVEVPFRMSCVLSVGTVSRAARTSLLRTHRRHQRSHDDQRRADGVRKILSLQQEFRTGCATSSRRHRHQSYPRNPWCEPVSGR